MFFFARLSSNPESKAHFGKPPKKNRKKTTQKADVFFVFFLVFGFLKCFFDLLFFVFFWFLLSNAQKLLELNS